MAGIGERRIGMTALLTLDNVGEFCSAVPGVLEVSIGHALISHAVEVGLRRTVQDYLHALRPRSGASA